ncbi:MAG: DUF47 family protein [Clostridiales bacterium]|nr:DUF47 family protein [Clostridiales bacterium]
MAKKQKNNYYFDAFVKMAEYSCAAADMLKNILSSFDSENIFEQIQKVHEIEHAGDTVRHELVNTLAKEFIAPIERDNIMQLAEQIDSVTDTIEDVAVRLYMYNVKEISPVAIEFADIVCSCCDEMKKMLLEFPNFKKSSTINNHLIEINRFEEEGDRLYIQAIHDIYKEGELTVKSQSWAETIEYLERCCDACEDVAEVVENVIMNNT